MSSSKIDALVFACARIPRVSTSFSYIAILRFSFPFDDIYIILDIAAMNIYITILYIKKRQKRKGKRERRREQRYIQVRVHLPDKNPQRMYEYQIFG